MYLKTIAFDEGLDTIDIGPYIFISDIYFQRGNTPMALNYVLTSVRIVEKRGNPDLEWRPYMQTGRYYYAMGKFDLAVEYCGSAIELFTKRREPPPGLLLDEYIYALVAIGRSKEGLDLLLKYTGAEYWWKYPRNEQCMILKSVSICYSNLGKYDKAEYYALKALDLAKKIDSNHEFQTRIRLGEIYLDIKNYAKAEYYLQPLIAMDTVPGQLSLEYRQALHDHLFKADTGLKNYTSAISHLLQQQQLKNEQFDDTKNKQLEELRLQYETEKKDQRISSLTKEERQSRMLRNVFIGSAALLVLLLAVIYNRYRLKQRSNRLLQQMNRTQQRLLTEKEWLMKEVHHRIKNNLQIVISLLNMQSSYLNDEFAVNAFGEIGHRIQAISLIHQKLYQVADMTVINMPEYIQQLVQFLEDSSIPHRQIRFSLHIDPIDLEVSQSVPVGLILNEAITNAIKHAFPDRSDGRITISMQLIDNDIITLQIADNGKGLPPSFNITDHDSMGLQLIRTLVEQLDGTILIESYSGFSITIKFHQQKSIFQSEMPSSLVQ